MVNWNFYWTKNITSCETSALATSWNPNVIKRIWSNKYRGKILNANKSLRAFLRIWNFKQTKVDVKLQNASTRINFETAFRLNISAVQVNMLKRSSRPFSVWILISFRPQTLFLNYRTGTSLTDATYDWTKKISHICI